MIPLDPKNRDTWINHAMPVPEIQKELTRAGGLVSNGAYAGQPRYKLAWGQTETEFLGGKHRIRFRDTRIPRLVRISRFFVSPNLTAKLSEWSKQNPVIDEMGCFVKGRRALKELLAEESSFEYQKLETLTMPEKEYRLMMHVPQIAASPNWLFVSEVEEVVSIGRQCWYVLRHLAAADYEKRESWNRNRFVYDCFLPEIGANVDVVDFNGPYPEHGVYTAYMEIAKYEGENYKDYKYLEPTFSNCVQPVLDEVETGALTQEEKDARRWEDRVAVAEDHMRTIDADEEAWDEFTRDAAPMFAGKTRVWQAPTPKVDGKDIIR